MYSCKLFRALSCYIFLYNFSEISLLFT